MHWFELAVQAFSNLNAAKMRSLLAVLGILVGTASVVALISSGRLATEKALEQFRSLGVDLLAVSAYPNQDRTTRSGRKNLTADFWNGIPEQLPSIKDIAPYAGIYQPLMFHGRTLKGSVIGADEALARIVKVNMEEGDFMLPVYTREHVCVIGADLARQLSAISLHSPIGRHLRIGGILYTITGVASPWTENGFFSEDINKAAIIPIGGLAHFNKEAQVNNAIMILEPDSSIDDVIAHLKRLIHIQAPDLNVFPRSAKQIIAGMESQGKIFTLLLAVIGGISLIVGGIGIMNVMLVSVSERRQEIGVRKAVGAKNSDIRALFLMESLMLSMLGGVLGVFSGLGVTAIIAWFSDWSFAVYGMPLMAGFLISCVTGVFFGYYPAGRAARMQVVDCLRI